MSLNPTTAIHLLIFIPTQTPSLYVWYYLGTLFSSHLARSLAELSLSPHNPSSLDALRLRHDQTSLRADVLWRPDCPGIAGCRAPCAAQHARLVKPIIERFPLTKAGVEKGMEKLRAGKMRYRGMLVVEE
ncbi:hypothetical protein B0H14DRAFT_2540610 [Mycena olivaceomarginata]|nr:hypothetical protein B0H14DRAFT_2540610 [Mycena olivaceomarginata]